MIDRQTKEFTARCVKETLAIVEQLYKSDRARYKPLFACVNKSIKQHRSVVLILQAAKRIAEKDGGAHKALDVTEYFFATLRKLEAEREAKKLRGGGAIENVKALDALAEMMRRAGYKVEKVAGGNE